MFSGKTCLAPNLRQRGCFGTTGSPECFPEEESTLILRILLQLLEMTGIKQDEGLAKSVGSHFEFSQDRHTEISGVAKCLKNPRFSLVIQGESK